MAKRAGKQAVGISGLALYVPPYRVNLENWCDWTNSDWPKIREVVGSGFRLLGPQQSVYTMAATAVMRLIEQFDVDPGRIGFLALGTESSTDNSAGAVIVKGMVDSALNVLGSPPISRNCEVPEFKHACLGGVYAMKAALRYLGSDGRDSLAIVVSTDKALYERGSSGEATQGAGAVAMLLEAGPRLLAVDLGESGNASAYRELDFRKPLLSRGANGHAACLDIPVFNGRYSTNCYVDEVQRALEDMYRKRRLNPPDYVRSVGPVFMHRPYQRMPETGWGLAYLFALAQGSRADLEELGEYCAGAGLETEAVVAEMRTLPELREMAVADRIAEDIFPLSIAVLRVFRNSEAFQRQVRSRMELGGCYMRELGNLYTGALPAWLAAGLAEARERDVELVGQEILTIGYGSGDAAEAIPMRPVENWQEAAGRIDIVGALAGAFDVSAKQYLALREGVSAEGLPLPATGSEFVVDRVGHHDGVQFQDVGVEYYRYVH